MWIDSIHSFFRRHEVGFGFFFLWGKVGDDACLEDGFYFTFPEGEDAPALGF